MSSVNGDSVHAMRSVSAQTNTRARANCISPHKPFVNMSNCDGVKTTTDGGRNLCECGHYTLDVDDGRTNMNCEMHSYSCAANGSIILNQTH